MRPRTLIILLVTSITLGCGPSLRRSYQSDNAFARCFDMDYNPAISAEEKQACWGRFLDDYVYNQPHDKIAYAELRLEDLADGISVPGPPGPPGAFHERPEPPHDSGRQSAPSPATPDAGADGGGDDPPEGELPPTAEPEDRDASVP